MEHQIHTYKKVVWLGMIPLFWSVITATSINVSADDFSTTPQTTGDAAASTTSQSPDTTQSTAAVSSTNTDAATDSTATPTATVDSDSTNVETAATSQLSRWLPAQAVQLNRPLSKRIHQPKGTLPRLRQQLQLVRPLQINQAAQPVQQRLQRTNPLSQPTASPIPTATFQSQSLRIRSLS